MQPDESPEVVQCLADGDDPDTGELRSPMALRALLLALDLLRREAARPGWTD